jgi:hypothetical protein
MVINTTTTDNVELRAGQFRYMNREFWNLAAHRDSNDPELLKAEKEVKACANRLMQSLLELVIET